MNRTITCLISLFLMLGGLSAQNDTPKRLLADMGFYADVMVNATAEAHREKAYNALTVAVDSFLALPDSYTISLDSIKWFSVLYADDFRMVTWQWKVNDENYKYGGFIQWPDRVVSLKDTRPFINGSSYSTYTPSAWYGALYYKILPFTRDQKKYYMLLGFNANTSVLNIKLADILDINGPDPVLGAPVFIGKDEPMTRLMITYADVSTVHIRYDEELGGIIYDHVENLPGAGMNGETLPVADGSLEGWILDEKGFWVYQEKVYDITVDTPPMTEERKDKKEDKDILGRPKKE